MKLAAIFLAAALGAFGVIFWWQYRQVRDELHTERTIKRKLATEVEALQGCVSSQQTRLVVLEGEAAIQRWLDWQRRGIYARHERKGAGLLVLKAPLPASPPVDPRLEVEFRQGGGAEIVPSPADPAGGRP